MQVSRNNMTQAIANEYLRYDPITGFIYRRKKYSNNTVKGRRACRPTNVTHQDHLSVKLLGVEYPAHRLAWLMNTGAFPIGHIDHVNHNELDNRMCNLRDVSQYTNNRNVRKRKDNTLGIVGVWCRSDVSDKAKKYVAEIRDCNSRKKTKSFHSLDDAIAQRKEWEIEFGYHANHGN